MAVNHDAAKTAATASGLRPDQVERAVLEYRKAAESLHTEPEWRSLMHMSGKGFGIAQYGAEGTRVTLEINSEEVRGEWRSETIYAFAGKAYETYGEAKAVELASLTKFTPHAVGSSGQD